MKNKGKEVRMWLERYQQGELSSEELNRLEEVTHKAEVLKAASRKASQRKSMVLVATALIAVSVAGGIYVVVPSGGVNTTPITAVKDDVKKPVIEEKREVMVEQPAIEQPATSTMAVRRHEEKQRKVGPKVYCNSQCDADSVISDIWKFLTV